MRALIVANQPERLRALKAPLDAADTECVVVDSWSAASPLLVQSPRPTLVVVTLDQLVHDGLTSLLAADAQLKVLRIPTLLVHDDDQSRDIEAVRGLVSFGSIQALPVDNGALTRAYNALVPGVAAITPTAEPLQSVAGDLHASDPASWLEPDEATLAVGTCVDRRYEIERLIETGGMGQIYRARQLPLGRPVALKVIRSDLAREAEALARFRLEAETVSRLHHPNTIVLYDYGIDQAPYPGRDDAGLMYLAMEWLEGHTLEQALELEESLAPSRVVHIAHQVALSLAEAHDKGIVHRDLKPSNIFVLSADDRVKVLDFGIAKLVDTPEAKAITRVGAICGTPEYMSPEQARGEDLDGRSDIYSLGCVMYAALAGRPPFAHEQALNVIIAHQTTEPEPLPRSVPDVVARVVMRCLAKKSHARVPTAVELATVLELIDAGEDQAAIDRLERDERRLSTATVAVRPPADPVTPQPAVPPVDARRQTSPSIADNAAHDLLLDEPDDALADLLGGRSDDASHNGGLDDLLGATDDGSEFELLDPFAVDESPRRGAGDAQSAALLDDPVDDLLDAPGDDLLAAELLADAPEEDDSKLVVEVPSLGSISLAEMSIARWLYLAWQQRLSGSLVVSRNRLSQRATLRDGCVLRASGGRIEPLLATFAWSDGELRLQPGTTGIGEPVEPLGLLYEGIRLHVSVNSVAADLARDNARIPVVTSVYARHQSAFDAIDGMRKLVAHCDGQRNLGTVMMSSGLGFETVCRAFSLALATDAIHLASAPVTTRPTVEYVSTGGPGAGVEASLSVADKLLVDQLERFIAQFRDGQHHAALGLQPGCGVDAVHAAYTKFSRDYAETRLRHKPLAVRALSEPLHAHAREALNALLEAESSTSLDSDEHALVERLERVHARFTGIDPYAAFGLEPGCGSDRVDDVYFQLVNEHHPDHFASHDRAEIKRAANEVFLALQDVYQQLIASEPERGPSPARPHSAPARPISSTARPISSTARPISSAARPISSAARPVSTVSKPASAPRPAAAASAAPPSSSNDGAQASRYRIAPPTRPAASTRTSGASQTVSRTTRRPVAGTPASPQATRATPPPSTDAGAPRKRKMSEILAERAARQASVASSAPPVATPADVAPASAAVSTEEVDARSTFRRGERHFERQQFSAALQLFEQAHAAEPGNGEYTAYLAWTRHVCDSSEATDTESLLKAARKTREGYVPATFFLGKLALQRQDLDAARGLFEAALSKNARHVGAQRELRLVKMRIEEEAASGGLFGKLKRKLTRRDS